MGATWPAGTITVAPGTNYALIARTCSTTP